eukprot:scaffold2909_cov45-Phaeocystis_antarctica.AAC.1
MGGCLPPDGVAFSRQVNTGLASLNSSERRISPTSPRRTMPPTVAPMATPATSPSVSPPESDDSVASCCASVAVTVGAVSTVILSDSLTAMAVVPRVEVILSFTAAAVLPAGK